MKSVLVELVLVSSSFLGLQAARLHTPPRHTAQTPRGIEAQQGENAVRLPSSNLQTNLQIVKTGFLTPNTMCAWSANVSGSPW